jgi:hypothetical protein
MARSVKTYNHAVLSGNMPSDVFFMGYDEKARTLEYAFYR